MSKIKKPIFIIGTGRCGSSIFHKLLSYHPQLVWTSGFCNRLPTAPWINRAVLKLDENRLLQPFLRSYVKPSETTLYWEHLAPGFSRAVKDLRAEDLHRNVKNNIIASLEKLETGKRTRQLHKFTGWPRTDYLLSIFPDAKFIHVYRDGRAVANSFFQVKWWHGWHGPENWLWGPLSREFQNEWEDHGKSFLVLAAIQWKILMDAFENAKKTIAEDQYMEIRYEDFTVDPTRSFEQVLQFCELADSTRFYKAISAIKLHGQNEKWRKNLTPAQIQLLRESLGDYCKKYGYSS